MEFQLPAQLPAWISAISLTTCAFFVVRMMNRFDRAHDHHYKKHNEVDKTLVAHDTIIDTHEDRLDHHDEEIKDLNKRRR